MPIALSPFNFPALTVQIAFASNPIGGSYTWVDVTKYVRTVKPRRGRQHVLNKFEPGSCTILFNGRDGALDPTNTASPYYPNVDINRRIRVLAGGSAKPIFTGFTASWLPKWPDKLSSDIEMVATDGLRLLATDTITSIYRATVVADGATHLWPLDDSTGAVADAIGTAHGVTAGGRTLGLQGPSFTDIAPATGFGVTGSAVLPSIGTLTPPLSLETWFQTNLTPADPKSAYLFGTGGPPDENGPITFITSVSATFNNGYATNMVAPGITLNINSRTGDTLILAIATNGYGGAGASTVVTDSAGNTWRLLATSDNVTIPNATEIWGCWRAQAVTSVNVVNVSMGGTVHATVLEFAGAIDPGIVDVTGAGEATTQTFSFATGARAFPNEMFVAVTSANTGSKHVASPMNVKWSVGATVTPFDVVYNGAGSYDAIVVYGILPGTTTVNYTGSIPPPILSWVRASSPSNRPRSVRTTSCAWSRVPWAAIPSPARLRPTRMTAPRW